MRLQFFKSFILPYFDYCSSLVIYFPKRALQKLANTYYYCTQKLLHLRFSITSVEDFNKVNNDLNKYNLDCYQHRLIKRISRFVYKVFNQKNSPANLKVSLTKNCDQRLFSINLRNRNIFNVPAKGKYNDHMETFGYFYSKFLNGILLKDLKNFTGFTLIKRLFVELEPKVLQIKSEHQSIGFLIGIW